jgi:hypothetical protein
MAKRFQKVQGSGFTNHCPHCLWSRHVDINPGDRAASCRGLMEPVAIELKSGEKIIVHRCLSCGELRRNKAAAEDRLEAMLKIMAGGSLNK